MPQEPPFEPDLERRFILEFEGKATPEFINATKAGAAAYVHGRNSFISKEKFLEWVEEMYNWGVKHREATVHEMGVDFRDPVFVGSWLESIGPSKGYLSTPDLTRDKTHD